MVLVPALIYVYTRAPLALLRVAAAGFITGLTSATRAHLQVLVKQCLNRLPQRGLRLALALEELNAF
jgi:hypothetical protein